METVNRIDEENYNTQGCLMKICDYYNAKNIKIKFIDDQKAAVSTTYERFKKGEVKNPYYKSLYGIGYIGNVYANKEYTKTKSFRIWKAMLDRCYGGKYPTYIDISVCKEWHSFYNFNIWFNNNYYECKNVKMNLDKDILVKHNKMYSPETCVFVPYDINMLFAKANAIRGDYPIGVSYEYDKYVSKCNNHNKVVNLGRFNTIDEAFNTYKEYKERLIKQIADVYKKEIPIKLYEALYAYQVDIAD